MKIISVNDRLYAFDTDDVAGMRRAGQWRLFLRVGAATLEIVSKRSPSWIEGMIK
jgi:hypothetical protein